MTDTLNRFGGVTIKGPLQADPWLTYDRVDGFNVFDAIIQDFGLDSDQAGVSLAELVAEATTKYAAILTASRGLGATGVPQGQPQQQGGYQQAAPMQQAAAPQSGAMPGDKIKDGGAPVPPGPRPSCQHGPRQWVTGVNAKGQYKFWACPMPQGQQCKSEWVNR